MLKLFFTKKNYRFLLPQLYFKAEKIHLKDFNIFMF